MPHSSDPERVRAGVTPEGSSAAADSKSRADAVQTPPPEMHTPVPPGFSLDPDAPTILTGLKTSTEIPQPSDAPTLVDGSVEHVPSGPRLSQKTPAGNWSGAFLPTGTVLGSRYEILRLLGEGGMGAVYKAKDTELDRVIALKVIRPELASNPEILQRFKQELVLARQVTDRNIIRIFDLGEADGVRFITMPVLIVNVWECLNEFSFGRTEHKSGRSVFSEDLDYLLGKENLSG